MAKLNYHLKRKTDEFYKAVNVLTKPLYYILAYTLVHSYLKARHLTRRLEYATGANWIDFLSSYSSFILTWAKELKCTNYNFIRRALMLIHLNYMWSFYRTLPLCFVGPGFSRNAVLFLHFLFGFCAYSKFCKNGIFFNYCMMFIFQDTSKCHRLAARGR